ncbi:MULTISPECIES: BaiN/RdsA family NAD(P)/FAD-dependent oxidoreductase [Chromobacterium]|uniref:NAD(P)/FAD-dependent oxidoreductase n=1 Tax=Chromobacterium TaxID=535 RepID=UPI0018883F31|nr:MULTISPECIES: NAD(P)/FAD-dependent oxidoreductase [Chromobacterium]QOZ84048.1 NAD(P)/FAD-dependent oxidoreductase [Chromobacterium sp. Rain0013]WON84199.1 NAD(P)/FAD-dependent oxidoreductase [Chromobacterium haemolyticum]
MQYDVIVIGAGAAGLMCAATAGQRGRRVLLLDHARKLAEKIRISGGGRCNFTNLHARFDCYLSANPHFCRSALAQYTPQDFIAMVERHGIGYHEKKLGQLFCDDGSERIIAMLDEECRLGGVDRRMETQILKVSREADGFVLDTGAGCFRAASLVVATGGLSIPQIGATPFGYQLAEQFGLELTPLTPALVPLTFHVEDAEAFAPLAGVSLEVEARAGKGRFRENVLFTHKGVSGPAILQVSSYWQPGMTLELDLLPDADAASWLEQKAGSEQLISNALAEFGWAKRFAEAWLEREGCNKRLKDLSPKQRLQLAERLHGWRVKPNGTQGYKKAEVTLGGVSTKALSSKTMMANAVPGLFFIGEVVDVTGWLGGYNFQWAWSSGYVAGMHC